MKDGDHLAIWVYLLLNATHEGYDSIFGNSRITLRAGQLITGRKIISRELKISESKVQRILTLLKNERQIEQQTSNQNRLITILNWDKYQQSEQQDEQRVNNERTTSEQRVNTYKNVKKDKNVKNGKKYNISEISEAVDLELQEVVDYYNQIFSSRISSTRGFEENYRYWRDIHQPETMKRAILAASTDKFWRDKLTLTILFRQKNPRGEKVDLIQDLSLRKETHGNIAFT